MRGSRVVAGAVAALLLGACGGKPFPTVAPAPGGNTTAVGVTVHLGADPRLAPIERLLSASKGRFNSGLFISAFDISAQPCNIVAVAQGVQGANVSPPVNPSTVRVLSVKSHGVTAAVELTDSGPFFLRVRQVNGAWVVDENACLWVSEAEGGDLPASAANGLARLSATDPRRRPAAALMESLTGTFNAARFVSAFDPSEQPCDVRGLARQVGVVAPTGTTEISPHYFVRPMGPGQDAVVVQAGAGALALRIHEINGQWRLNEDACTWLVSLVATKTKANDIAVESDLRNALTAEKTTYTDTQMYDASPTVMRQIEPGLDWGGRLRITVSDAETSGDRNVICLAERSATGKVLAIADVAVGPWAGTYYFTNGCPAPLTARGAATPGHSNGWSQ